MLEGIENAVEGPEGSLARYQCISALELECLKVGILKLLTDRKYAPLFEHEGGSRSPSPVNTAPQARAPRLLQQYERSSRSRKYSWSQSSFRVLEGLVDHQRSRGR